MNHEDEGRLPAKVGVYGGGRMGGGIAHALLAAGSTVVVIESDDQRARAAEQSITASLATAEARGKLDEPAEALARLLTVTREPAVLDGCGLVIEAVPENLDLKRAVLTRMARSAPGAVLATNTSALGIDELADAVPKPDQFIGLHFFNPVPVSELVEIVVGVRTAPDLPRRAAGWVRRLGKSPITVTDSPGFASSRLGVLLALEAMRMLETNVASAEDIDAAMTLGYKHPMGPLRTTDVVGLDVRLAIAEHLHRELGDRFEPPAVLRHLVARGHLGRKTGEGFYSWS